MQNFHELKYEIDLDLSLIDFFLNYMESDLFLLVEDFQGITITSTC